MATKTFDIRPIVWGGILSLAWKVASNAPFIKDLPPSLVLVPLGLGSTYAVLRTAWHLIKWYRLLPPDAVELFLLDDENRLCMYHHPHHKRRLPPGGRVGRLETIYEALERTLESRMGLNKDEYELINLCEASVAGNEAQLGKASLCPCPFRIQTEHHSQRLGKQLHMDFLFVGRIRQGKKIAVAKEYQPAGFLTREQVSNLVKNQETLPDVLDAYDAILDSPLLGPVK